MPHVLPLTLERRQPGRIRPELATLRAALDRLGTPHTRFRSILVVGTNGKGSTAALVDSILRAHQVSSALYTSPHLVAVEERISINGQPVTRAELEHTLEILEEYPELSFFETLTAAAFLIFAARGVEVAVLEAGMGGRWDATRLAGSAIAGLTNVGSDHARWLGRTRAEVAADKGSALEAASIGVYGPQVDAATAALLGAPQARGSREWVQLCRTGSNGFNFTLGASSGAAELPLEGVHQEANLSLALALCAAAHQLGWLPQLDPECVARGVARTRWPARLSEHVIAGRRVLLDCAHNLEAATALSQELAGRCGRFNLLFSCLDDKPVEAMAKILRPQVAQVMVCSLVDDRAMPLKRLQAAFPGAGVAADPRAGLTALPDPVLAAGSLRLAGALLALADEEVSP